MRLNAAPLFYAMVVLVGVFLMVAISGPSTTAFEYAPVANAAASCDPERVDLPCAASGGDVLVGGEVRVS